MVTGTLMYPLGEENMFTKDGNLRGLARTLRNTPILASGYDLVQTINQTAEADSFWNAPVILRR